MKYRCYRPFRLRLIGGGRIKIRRGDIVIAFKRGDGFVIIEDGAPLAGLVWQDFYRHFEGIYPEKHKGGNNA